MAAQGVGRFTELTTREHVAAGRLVPVLQEWEAHGGPPVNLLHRPSQRRTPRFDLRVDFVTALLREREADGPQRLCPERPLWHRRGPGRASSILRARLCGGAAFERRDFPDCPVQNRRHLRYFVPSSGNSP